MSITRLTGSKAAAVPALLAAPSGEVHAVRMVLADRCISFPCHLLERWERIARGELEELKIFIGRRSVLVRGHGLEVLHSALDAGTARQVQVGTGGKGGEGQIQITEITLSTAPVRADGLF